MITGIDLGTTFSAIAYVNQDGKAEIITNRDGERTTPSVVLFEDGAAIVGKEAKANSIMAPENVCQFVKRQMGRKAFSFDTDDDESYSAEEISAMILRRLREDAEDFTGEPTQATVITVPAYFNDAQRNATKDAGEIAGLNVLGIINEPTAAAIAYCHGKANSDGTVMVFDLGGGTFDITILELKDNLSSVRILSTTGNRNLGGFDFDNLLIQAVTEAFEKEYGVDISLDDTVQQDLRQRAEDAKKALSAKAKTTISLVAAGKRFKYEITREQFEKMLKKHLETCADSMDTAMEDAGLSYRNLDKILLVGGSTRIPAFQKMIQEKTGIEPSHELNPDEAVAMGAAYYAASLVGLGEASVDVVDVNSHSLGVISMDSERDVLVASFIIPRNTPLPASDVRFFSTMRDNQEQAEVQVVEGEDENPDYDTIIGEGLLDLPSMPAHSPMAFVMRCDRDGVVHLEVIRVIETEDSIMPGDLIGEMTIARKANLTTAEVQAKKHRIEGMDIE